MQKVIQRTQRAERVTLRRAKKQSDHYRKGESWERNQMRLRMQRINSANIVEARKNRREDWETGRLAPRRDVGDKAETYGAIDIYEYQIPAKDPEQRIKNIFISEGDRVVITRGRERGKIGEVQAIDRERNALRVKDLNMVDVVIPEWMMREQGIGKVQSFTRAISFQDVKLVYPLPDPKTGIPRDVIIDRLEGINKVWDKNKREWSTGDRVISGTNIIVPWPEKADEEFQDHEDDTLRISVEEQTFRPYLLQAPMPNTVIDELRNKYSRFRTRHDWEYVQKKEMEDTREEKRKDLGKTMRTPLQELAELRAKQKKAAERELTDEQLAKIGEVIAQERTKAKTTVEQLVQ